MYVTGSAGLQTRIKDMRRYLRSRLIRYSGVKGPAANSLAYGALSNFTLKGRRVQIGSGLRTIQSSITNSIIDVGRRLASESTVRRALL